jgi:hypothetical protein
MLVGIWEQIKGFGGEILLPVSLVFTAGMIYSSISSTVSAHETRIATLERHDSAITRMEGDIELIMRELHIQPLAEPDQ